MTGPGPSTQTLTGQRSKVPATVTSTELPRWAPAGNRESKVGGAADARAGTSARRLAARSGVKAERFMLTHQFPDGCGVADQVRRPALRRVEDHAGVDAE